MNRLLQVRRKNLRANSGNTIRLEMCSSTYSHIVIRKWNGCTGKHYMRTLGSLTFNTRSKALFKPVMGIGLVVESFYLLVSRVPVQLDGFNECVVRFQLKDCHSRFPGLVLQSL